MSKSPFNQYVDYLATKYHDQMTDWERDVVTHHRGLRELDHLTTDEEKDTLAHLWGEEFNRCGREE